MTDPVASKSDSYLVVARRYRPQGFDELIGQEHIARALVGAIRAGRVGHAYLFTGARGVGKTSSARILAKALNCEHGPTPTPCNVCEVCRSITAGDDVDVLEIDGASNRGIDEIRQLRQNVSIRPSRVRYKIYIIDEVHMLTKEAFNALLKTLEEPPEHVKFIFATTEPQKVPITILSRCQRFDFAGISAQAIEARLAAIAETEGVLVEPEALAILARRAAGSMRDGQSLLEQLLAAGGDRITVRDVTHLLGIATTARIERVADRLLARDTASALAELDAAVGEGADLGMFLEQLLGFFRDLLVLAIGGSDDQVRFALPSQLDPIRALARETGVETLLAAMQVLDQTVGRARLTVDLRTLAEMALVRISRLENLDDLAAAIAEFRRMQGPVADDSKKNDPATASRGLFKQPDPRSGDRSALQANRPIPRPESVAVGSSEPQSPASQSPAPEPPESPAPEPQVPLRSQPIPLEPDMAATVWQEAIESIGGILAGNAKMADRVELDGTDRLVVYFSEKYTSCKEFCEFAERRERLLDAVAATAGTPAQLSFVLTKAGMRKTRRHALPRSRRQMRRIVGERPFVQRAAELFEADMERLKLILPEQ